jgi:hypothetical protein
MLLLKHVRTGVCAVLMAACSASTSQPNCDPINPEVSCGPGRNCTVHPINASTVGFHCVETGTAIGGAACTPGPPPNPCAPGYDCIFYDDDATTACVKYCRLDHPADCAAGSRCIAPNAPIVVQDESYGSCSTPCDPAAVSGSCAGGARCIAFDPPDANTRCVVTTSQVKSSGCSYSSECKPGWFCDSSVCRRWCHLEDAAGCPVGT